jgi:hypothetical protein
MILLMSLKAVIMGFVYGGGNDLELKDILEF